jgi:hypothetical protein
MRNRILRSGLALIAALAAASAAAAQAPAEGPERSILSGNDFTLFPPAAGGAVFRFLPDGVFAPFDRALVLSAAPGETRTYIVQTATSKEGAEDAPATSYLIDKRRPRAPRCSPSTGLFRDPIDPILTGDKGASIFWAIIGQGGTSQDFVEFKDGAKPSLKPPASGTATYTLVAYAVDAAGNRSYPSRFVFRLAEPGLQAAAPAADSWEITRDPSLPQPMVDVERGYSTIKAAVPEGSTLLLDFAPASASAPQTLDDFEQVAPQDGMAFLRVPCPYGWTGELLCYSGLIKGGQASFNPQPLKVQLMNPVDEFSSPLTPEGPSLEADPNGRGAYVIFPSYDGKLFASIDDGDALPYTVPLPVAKGRRSVKVSWYGEDESGERTQESSATLSLPEFLGEADLVGISEGASTAKDVTLKSNSKTVLRYEMRLDGSLPPEPGPSSPLLGDGLSLSCPPGEERAVVLRYRAFSGDQGGEGRILRFELDKKPPEAPLPVELVSTRSDKAISLKLAPGAGGKDVFASISADGSPAGFVPVKGTIDLPGSQSGPVTYTIRAYDLDAAGNKSQEMKSLELIVDLSSVYAAGDGVGSGDGSPDKPFKSLDAAVASALAQGKHNINIRGMVESKQSLSIRSDLSLTGGYDGQWARDPAASAAVRLAMPATGSAWAVGGCALSLRKVDLRVEGQGSGSALSIQAGSLSVDDSSIGLASDGDLVLVAASKAQIGIRGSRIAASKGMSCSLFSADASDIKITSCSIAASQGVRVFGGFDMDSGSLSLSDCILESRADLGLSLLSLRSTSLLVDRSLIRAEGGSGFLRLGSFGAVKGEVRNSKAFVSWNGSGTLFEGSASGPAFHFDTIVCDGGKGPFRFFDAKGWRPEVWDSILDCSAPGSELLRSDLAPAQGELAADCVWGFEFLLAGAVQAKDLAALNGYNSGSEPYGSRPIIAEPPDRSFGAPVKNLSQLKPDSACVGSAIPIEGCEIDFSGKARPGPGNRGPDIGADELLY